MRLKSKSPLNTAALSKKYKCDVNRLIRCWKNGKNDFEISQTLGLDMLKILQIRQEIAYLHEKERQLSQKKSFPQNSILNHNPR